MPKIRLLQSGEISESDIHRSVMAWVRAHASIAPFVIHVPNEGKRSLRYGFKLKELGMRAGVSDLFIALARHEYHGAWIELKSKKGILSLAQKQFQDDMRSQNYYTSVTYTLDEAISVLQWYCLS